VNSICRWCTPESCATSQPVNDPASFICSRIGSDARDGSSTEAGAGCSEAGTPPPRQIINGSEQPRTPLITRDDIGVTGRTIVSIFRPKTPGIEALWPGVENCDAIVDLMHTEFSGVLDAGLIAEPPPFSECNREVRDRMRQERCWILRNLEAGRKELLGIRVDVKDDSTEIRTRNGFHQFSSSNREGIAYAKIYAYVALPVWIALGVSGTGVASDLGDGIVGD
jgi:hypothetical protein